MGCFTCNVEKKVRLLGGDLSFAKFFLRIWVLCLVIFDWICTLVNHRHEFHHHLREDIVYFIQVMDNQNSEENRWFASLERGGSPNLDTAKTLQQWGKHDILRREPY